MSEEARIDRQAEALDGMLADPRAPRPSGDPALTGLHLYVPDADQVYRAALEAGADSLRAPVDQPYGDREASVRDVAGNHWYIATHQTGGHVPAGLGTVTPYLHPRGAPAL